MKTVYILEAIWHDTIGRNRHNKIIGVFEDLSKIETIKNEILHSPHKYSAVSFSINQEIQPFVIS